MNVATDPPGETATIASVTFVVESNLASMEPSRRSVTCAVTVRVEPNARTPHHVTVY